jgi:hypothetical protein
MSVAVQSSKTLIVLLVSCFFVYAGGVYLTRAFLCQPVGAWVLLAGVVVGSIVCALLGFSAFQLRSVWRTTGVVALALALTVMFLSIGVFTLPGCSGV